MLDEYQRLAALIAAENRLEIRRLHKSMLLLQTMGAPFSYVFQMGISGPYSEALDEDLRLLSEQGLIRREYTEDSANREMVFSTASGVEILKRATELKPFLKAAGDLKKAPHNVLDLAAKLAVWVAFGYPIAEAQARMGKSLQSENRADIEREALELIQKHGSATVT